MGISGSYSTRNPIYHELYIQHQRIQILQKQTYCRDRLSASSGNHELYFAIDGGALAEGFLPHFGTHGVTVKRDVHGAFRPAVSAELPVKGSQAVFNELKTSRTDYVNTAI